MSATDKKKLDGIATGAGVQVNSDWNATNGVSAILHKPTKVSAFQNDSGYLTSHQSLANYALKTDIPTVTTYTAGQGIKIKNGVISVITPTKVGKPTCSGYTLYGKYFLSDIFIPNKNWEEACDIIEVVIVTQNYSYGNAQINTVVARVLSKTELETLSANKRKISENEHSWYWTRTSS